VEAFLDQVPTDSELWIGRGQCIEHYGVGEAYLPVLDALGRLCREADGKQLIEFLSQHAPTWLAQMPAILSAAELEALQRKTQGATRERMLRELAEAVEVLTAERALVLVVEDLHWSDPSTLDWLAFVARRQERARVLVISTYRPGEMLTEGHPLKGVTQELFAHQLGTELPLSRLSEAEVTAYLALRFPAGVLPTRLGQVLYQRTGGNPLFLISMVQELISRGVLLQGQEERWAFQGTIAELGTWTPESVRYLLARQRERLLPEAQRVLEAASLAGLEFSAAVVAAALEVTVTEVEAQCGRLAEQQHFLRPAGISDWPDGTRAARYGFQHALYQEFWHERVSVGHQQQWHLRMGERQEVGYGSRAQEIAGELALHFTEGREYRKAIHYLHQASETAIRRSANQEAINLLTKGLELVKTLPATRERVQQELILQLTLGAPLMATKGFAASEVEQAYDRAYTLSQQIGEAPQLFRALWGLYSFHTTRAESQKAREVAEQCLRLAQRAQEPALLMMAYRALGSVLYNLGEFTTAEAHFEQALTYYDPQQHRSLAFSYGVDLGVAARGDGAQTLWYLGYPDQALRKSQEVLTQAKKLSHTHTVAYALLVVAHLHCCRREWQVAQEYAEELIAFTTEWGLRLFSALGRSARGWALAGQGQYEEGLAEACQGMATQQATGLRSGVSRYLSILAEASGRAGQTEEGLRLLAEAWAAVDRTGQHYYEAEVYRLKGELTLQKFQVSGSRFQVANPQLLIPNPQAEAEAEACFHKAIEIARRQSAKSLELRAVMSLSRLWQQQGKRAEARQLLAEIYDWFTEGFDTKDLQEAKALLEDSA
jgi:predicted ATPase